jgi:hypothetical protein
LTFFRDVCDLEIDNAEAFTAYEVAHSRCGFYSLHPDFAMVCDRPRLLKRDAGGRLHANRGAAIEWRDGWGLCFWHGLHLGRDHEWIARAPEQLNPEKIESERNAEIRRVMLEAYGFERYLAARNPRVVAVDELHGQPRRLLEIVVAGEPLRIIEVHNGSLEPDGTRRRFHLGAMRGETPHDVVAASYGISPKAYLEAVRT